MLDAERRSAECAFQLILHRAELLDPMRVMVDHGHDCTRCGKVSDDRRCHLLRAAFAPCGDGVRVSAQSLLLLESWLAADLVGGAAVRSTESSSVTPE